MEQPRPSADSSLWAHTVPLPPSPPTEDEQELRRSPKDSQDEIHPVRTDSSDTQATKALSTVDLFDLAHSRKHHHDSEEHSKAVHALDGGLHWNHLFKRPVVRQFIVGNVSVQETAKRDAARFELFFDLVFVGIIHVLAERVAEELSSSWGLFKFVAFFWLAWSIWQDVRQFINVSGTDDVPQRLFVLVVMALLLGFSANAAAVTIECGGEPAATKGAGAESGAEPAATGEGETSAAEHVGRFLFRRLEQNFGDAFDLGGGCVLEEGWAKSARAAIAFFLVAKLIRVLMLILYGAWLPRFRIAHCIRAYSIVASVVWWIPLTALDTPKIFVILPILTFGLELGWSYALPLFLKLTHTAAFHKIVDRFTPTRKKPSSGRMHSFIPAVNLELTVTRLLLFNIVILGEMILSVTFTATGSTSGLHTKYLRCVLCLILASTLMWTFDDSDGSRTFLHPLRRHFFAALTWQHLHFPLYAALVLVSVAMQGFVADDSPSQSLRWLFGASLSVVLLILLLLALLTRPLDIPTSSLLPRPLRLLTRLIASLIFALLPLADEEKLDATQMLGVAVGLLVSVCVAETVGKVGSVADWERVERALQARRGGEGRKKERGDRGERSDGEAAEAEEESAPEALKRELGLGGGEGASELRGIEEGRYELMDIEKGEEDAGVEGDLGEMRVIKLGRQQKLAYAF